MRFGRTASVWLKGLDSKDGRPSACGDVAELEPGHVVPSGTLRTVGQDSIGHTGPKPSAQPVADRSDMGAALWWTRTRCCACATQRLARCGVSERSHNEAKQLMALGCEHALRIIR